MAERVSLRIAFVKTGESHDRIYVTRDDGQELGWRWPAAPMLPHDLVHWVVESRLGLDEGFWGLLAQGVDFGAVNAAGHSPGGGRLAERDVTELRQSEALVSAAAPDLPGLARTAADRLAELGSACARAGVPMPDVGEATIAELASEVAAYDARWRSLPRRAAIDVEFAPRR